MRTDHRRIDSCLALRYGQAELTERHRKSVRRRRAQRLDQVGRQVELPYT